MKMVPTLETWTERFLIGMVCRNAVEAKSKEIRFFFFNLNDT